MSSTFRTRSYTAPDWWKPIVLFVVVGVAILGGQMWYVRAKLPEVGAELVAAKAEADSVFAQLAPPDGAPPEGEMEKRVSTGGPRGKWQGVESGFVWTQAYMVPGDFGPISEEYRKRLQGRGWKPFDGSAPGQFQRVFKRDKWIATVSGNEWWDHPRRTRVRVRLEWDFRHQTGYRTSLE